MQHIYDYTSAENASGYLFFSNYDLMPSVAHLSNIYRVLSSYLNLERRCDPAL